MAARALHAVKPDEKPGRTKRLNAREAASAGDRKALLEAMQERIARAVDDERTPPRDLASLSRRLQDISRELEGMADEEPNADRSATEAGSEAFDASAV